MLKDLCSWSKPISLLIFRKRKKLTFFVLWFGATIHRTIIFNCPCISILKTIPNTIAYSLIHSKQINKHNHYIAFNKFNSFFIPRSNDHLSKLHVFYIHHSQMFSPNFTDHDLSTCQNDPESLPFYDCEIGYNNNCFHKYLHILSNAVFIYQKWKLIWINNMLFEIYIIKLYMINCSENFNFEILQILFKRIENCIILYTTPYSTTHAL